MFLAMAVISAGQAHGGLLYSEHAGSTLQTIDTDTLAFPNIIGPSGVATQINGLAYDPNADILYGIDSVGVGGLYTINRSTGAASFIGVTGGFNLQGLAFDSLNNVLYATETFVNGGLFEINPSTGASTRVGTLASAIAGLAYDSLNDQLVGSGVGTGDLFGLNRATAAQALLFDGPLSATDGLAYDPDKNLFWSIGATNEVYSYDPSNGFARTVHPQTLTTFRSLAYVSSAATIPEPSSIVLLGVGLVGLAVGVTRRRLGSRSG